MSQNNQRRAVIEGIGFYVPPCVVTNYDLAKLMDTSDEWITQRTGIKERRYVDEGVAPSDLALWASQAALKDANLKPEDIEFIILGTLSPDHTFPGTSCFLQDKLGIPGTATLDIRNQCTAFIYGISIADQFIRSGMYKRVLVVGTEVHSTGLDFSTAGRDVTVLFGDGSGAAVLVANEEKKEKPRGILSSHLHADGHYARDLWIESPGSRYHPRIRQEDIEAGRCYPKMNGRSVFTMAVKKFPDVIMEALSHNQVKIEDVNLFIFHQANLRIIETVCSQMGIPQEKTYVNIHKYGNTTAGSIPIALAEAKQAGRIKQGDLVCLTAFGAGFTWGASLIRW